MPDHDGKAVAPVEFGASIDPSLDEKGMARIEKLFFDACNESEVLIIVVERYYERTGHYPERALADQRRMAGWTRKSNTPISLARLL